MGAGLRFSWCLALGGRGAWFEPLLGVWDRCSHRSLNSHKGHLVGLIVHMRKPRPSRSGEVPAPPSVPPARKRQMGIEPGCWTLQERLLFPLSYCGQFPPGDRPPGRGTLSLPLPLPCPVGSVYDRCLSTRSLESQPSREATCSPFTAEETEAQRGTVWAAGGLGRGHRRRVCLEGA